MISHVTKFITQCIAHNKIKYVLVIQVEGGKMSEYSGVKVANICVLSLTAFSLKTSYTGLDFVVAVKILIGTLMYSIGCLS